MIQFKIKLFSNFMKVLLTLFLFINFAFALNLQKPSTYEDYIDIYNVKDKDQIFDFLIIETAII